MRLDKKSKMYKNVVWLINNIEAVRRVPNTQEPFHTFTRNSFRIEVGEVSFRCVVPITFRYEIQGVNDVVMKPKKPSMHVYFDGRILLDITGGEEPNLTDDGVVAYSLISSTAKKLRMWSEKYTDVSLDTAFAAKVAAAESKMEEIENKMLDDIPEEPTKTYEVSWVR